jgi:hypothetical protein
LRFSLRSLFVLMTIPCVWLGWHTHRVNAQRDVRAQLKSLGVGLSPADVGELPVPKWLQDRLGPDHFGSISVAGLAGNDLRPERLGRIVDQLVRLPALRSLNVSAHDPMTIETYRQLARLDRLETLYIHTYDGVAGPELAPLTGMRRLRSLEFQEAFVELPALEAMAAIKSLEELRVPSLSDESRQRLEKSFPNLRVYHTGNYAP